MTARRRRRWPGPPSRPPASPTCGPTAACAGWAWPSTSRRPTPAGRTWYFDVAGPNSAYRGGMVRSETVWRALGRAHVMAARGIAPFVVLTTQLPRPGYRGRPGPAGAGAGRDLRRRRPARPPTPGAARRLRRRPGAAPRCPGSGRPPTWRRGRLTWAAPEAWAPSSPARSCATIPRVSSWPRTSTRSTGCWPASWWPRPRAASCREGERAALRQALREERWGDAVFAFIARTGIAVDVYESTELHVGRRGRRRPARAAAHPPVHRVGGPASGVRAACGAVRRPGPFGRRRGRR